MKTVKAYQTSDGILHNDELAALKQEFVIEVRGTLQRCTRQATLTTTEVAQLITRNTQDFMEVITKFRRKFHGYDARKKESVKIVA